MAEKQASTTNITDKLMAKFDLHDSTEVPLEKSKSTESNKPTAVQVNPPVTNEVMEIPQDLSVAEKKSVPQEDEDLEEITPPKEAQAAFAHQRKIYKDKIRQLKDQLSSKEVATVNANSDQEKKLREELAETKKKLASYSLTEDEEFLNKYDKPLIESYQNLVKIVKELDGDEETVRTAMRLGYKERIKYLHEKLPEAISLILPLTVQLDHMDSSRTKAIENYETEKNNLKQLKFEREKRYKDELYGNSFGAALKNLIEGEKQLFLLKSDSDTKWNSLVDRRIEAAKQILNSDDAYVKAETVLRAVVSDDYKRSYEQSAKRVAELEKELGIRGRVRGGGSTGGGGLGNTELSERSVRKPRSGLEVANLITKGYT
jgi:hypothetical protein